MTHFPVVVAVAALLTLLPSLSLQLSRAEAAPADGNEAKVDELFSAVTDTKSPGAAIAVVRDNEVVLVKGYGLADVERRTSITAQTVFRIGSVTKCFTAIAILQLHEKGQLDIDNPIAEYLPDFPHGDQVWVRHLLSHTAGVPDFVSYEEAKTRQLDFAPGERINYSNTGYQMLGKIIEAASGQSYGEYLQTNIFRPLGMTRSGYGGSAKLAGRATGYLLSANRVYEAAPPGDATGAFAAGGIYSTVEDMVRWEQGIADNKLLKRKTLDQAFEPGGLNQGRRTAYGFGWMVREWRGLREVGHGGDITGFNSYFVRYPGQRITIVVLCNTGMQPPGPLPTAGDLAHRIAEIYLGDRVGPQKPRIPATVSSELLDAYVGRYELDAPEAVVHNAGKFVTVTRDGNRLVSESKQMKIPLEARSESTFDVVGAPVEVSFTFVLGADGSATEMIVNLMGLREYVARRVP